MSGLAVSMLRMRLRSRPRKSDHVGGLMGAEDSPELASLSNAEDQERSADAEARDWRKARRLHHRRPMG
jgi:hypothetical protein